MIHLTVVVLMMATCAVPPSPAARLAVMPVADRVYKVAGQDGLEDWVLALGVEGDSSTLSSLTVAHLARGATVHRAVFSSTALKALTRRQDETRVVENLHFELPAALQTDTIHITLVTLTHTLSTTVALVHHAQANAYHLPFAGCWYVASGHDFGGEHRRHLSRGHFAWDFIRVDAEGQPARGARAADHLAWAQPVLAPAAGVVVQAVGGFADNPVGRTSPDANVVVIDHGHGEFSRVLHLMKGSLQVRAGQSVVAGQLLGRVGNSGRSDAPHLHIGFERHPSNAGGEEPIPVEFSAYRAHWNRGEAQQVARGRPRRGQFVCSAAQAPPAPP